MKHKIFIRGFFQRFNKLFIPFRPQGDNGQTLRLPAGKEAGPVRARQDIHLTGYGADFLQPPAVGTAAFFNDQATHFLIFNLVKNAAEQGLRDNIILVLFKRFKDRHIPPQSFKQLMQGFFPFTFFADLINLRQTVFT